MSRCCTTTTSSRAMSQIVFNR